MIRIILFLTILFCQSTFAQDARALLKFVEAEGSIKVGETYLMELTIFPFDKSLVEESTFLDKLFLDYFYVTKVHTIFQSENNQDAVVVKMRSVVAKNFKRQAVYIWNLGDINIPIEVEELTVEDSKLSIKDFTILETGKKFTNSSYILYVSLLFIILIVLGLWFYQRKPIDKEIGKREKLIERLVALQGHSGLEELYQDRNEFMKLFDSDKNLEKNFKEMLEMYEVNQFSTEWLEHDIEPILNLKENLIKEAKLGV